MLPDASDRWGAEQFPRENRDERDALDIAFRSSEGETTMALDIVTQDIIIDETTGLQDNDVNPLVAPHNNATYLLGLDSAGGLTSPEVAFRANFVQATASAGDHLRH